MKKPFYKRWLFWVIVVLALGIIGMFTNDKETEKTTSSNITDKKELKDESEQKNPKTKKQESELKNTEKKTNASDPVKKIKKWASDSGIKAEVKMSGKNVAIIEDKNKSIFSENTLIKGFAQNSAELLSHFKKTDYQQIIFVRPVKMEDSRGNSSYDNSLVVLYEATNFKSINYKNWLNNLSNLAYNFFNESNAYYIHPGIYKNITDDDFAQLETLKDDSSYPLFEQYYQK